MYCPFHLNFLPFTTEEGYLSPNKILNLSVRFWVLKCRSRANIITALYFNVCVRKAKLPGDLDLRMKALGDSSHYHVSLVHFLVIMGKENINSGGKGPDEEKLAALYG